MSMDLDLRCLTDWLMMPEAMELSVFIGVVPCGCPMSSNEVLCTSSYFALINRPSKSASSAEAITFFKMAVTTNIAPLFLVCEVGLKISLRKKFPHTLHT